MGRLERHLDPQAVTTALAAMAGRERIAGPLRGKTLRPRPGTMLVAPAPDGALFIGDAAVTIEGEVVKDG